MGDVHDRAWIYALAPRQMVHDAIPDLERAVARNAGRSPSASDEVHVSHASGWIRFERAPWSRPGRPPALPPANEARHLAESFYRALVRATSPLDPAWPEHLHGLAVLPTLVRPVSLEAVPRDDGRGADAWLYRAQPYLPLRRGGAKAMVFGSQIEVRIGHGGEVTTFGSRWSPLSGERLSTTFRSIEETSWFSHDGENGGGHGASARHPATGHDDDAHGGGSAPPHDTVYWLQGDGVPQHYLAPYHLVGGGHAIALASASPYSLTAWIERHERPHVTRLLAHVLGGSGDYAFEWATYTIDDAVEDGIVPHGPGRLERVVASDAANSVSSIELPKGAYIVMVHVSDRRTGAFHHHQQEVFSTPAERDDDTRLVA